MVALHQGGSRCGAAQQIILKIATDSNVPAFRYNYTTGVIQAVPPIAPVFSAAVSSEIPRYIALWNQKFAPFSTTNYKVRPLRDVARD